MGESQKTILIGVDGGGTGSRVLVADENLQALAAVKGGPANVATDFPRAIENIRDAIFKAGQEAGLGPEALTTARVHLGLAGAISENVANQVARALSFEAVTVTDDRPTSVAGALGGQDGFLLSVGTGTIVAARRNGQNSYVGGWGFYVADQASGAWLGRRLLEEVLLCNDRINPHSDLTRMALGRYGDDPNQIVSFSVAAAPGDYGRLAPDVMAAAKAGDPVGEKIVLEGVAYLDRGLRVLGFERGNPLCLTGGVGQAYLQFLPDDLTGNVIAPLGSPVEGAVRLAALAAAPLSQVTP